MLECNSLNDIIIPRTELCDRKNFDMPDNYGFMQVNTSNNAILTRINKCVCYLFPLSVTMFLSLYVHAISIDIVQS